MPESIKYTVRPGESPPARDLEKLPADYRKGFSPVDLPASRETADIDCITRTDTWDWHRKSNTYRLTGLSYDIQERVDNLFLAFYRFVPVQPESDSYTEHKNRYLEALQKRWTGLDAAEEVVHHVAQRQRKMLEALRTGGWYVPDQLMSLAVEGRLIAGLGYKGALEVGITLHPLYGFPYLPGTALKGIARSWAELCLLPRNETTKAEIKAVFGSDDKDETADAEKQTGGVVFFDALPARFPALELDVMTPHFGPYYQNGKRPGDWHSPIPVTFLTVGAGTVFDFGLAVPLRSGVDAAAARALAEKATTWLDMGLRELGAGGKTAAGYGYFMTVETEAAQPGDGPATPETQPPPGVKPPPDDPFSQPRLTKIGRNTTGIPARVTGRRGNMLLVRLHAVGYEAKEFELGGVRADDFAEEDGVYVAVAGFSTKKRRVTQISYERRV